MQFQGLAQNETGLRHGTFECVYNEDNAVYHFQDTFYLAAEIGMSGSVDDIDLCAVVGNGCIFRKDGDTAFALDGIGVHHAFCHFLIGTEHTALF